MKVGLFSDVHANLPALEAVLDDMPPVDDCHCAGDVVGYNPWPSECLELVREECSLVVQGNHDRTVETPERYSANEMAMAGLEHARAELDDDQLAYLADRPKRTEFCDGAYRLVHSHPDPEQLGRYVRPSDFTRMRSYLDDYDGLVLGHTHVQHAVVVDERLVVNPGSVVQPRDGNSDAAYAVLDTETNAVDLRRVSYDIERVVDAVEEAGLPTRTGSRLLDGA